MKFLNVFNVCFAGFLFACNQSREPVMDAFLAEWNVEVLPETFSLENRNENYPNVLLGDGVIATVFSDGDFISTMGGRDYSGHFIICNLVKEYLNPGDGPYIRKIVDTDRDYLPDRVEYSNGDILIGRAVVTDDGFNIEFRKDNTAIE